MNYFGCLMEADNSNETMEAAASTKKMLVTGHAAQVVCNELGASCFAYQL